MYQPYSRGTDLYGSAATMDDPYEGRLFGMINHKNAPAEPPPPPNVPPITFPGYGAPPSRQQQPSAMSQFGSALMTPGGMDMATRAGKGIFGMFGAPADTGVGGAESFAQPSYASPHLTGPSLTGNSGGTGAAPSINYFSKPTGGLDLSSATTLPTVEGTAGFGGGGAGVGAATEAATQTGTQVAGEAAGQAASAAGTAAEAGTALSTAGAVAGGALPYVGSVMKLAQGDVTGAAVSAGLTAAGVALAPYTFGLSLALPVLGEMFMSD